MSPLKTFLFVATVFMTQACIFVKPAPFPPAEPYFQKIDISGLTNNDIDIRQAQICAGRINGHANAATASYGVRTTFAMLGAIFSGAAGGGGGLVALLSTNAAIQQSGGIVALIGGSIGVLGAALGMGLADPSHRLDLRSRAVPYYSRALVAAEALQSTTDATSRARLHAQMRNDLNTCINDGTAPPGVPNAIKGM